MQLRKRIGYGAPVLRIADDRKAHMRAVDTQLVRPSGDGAKREQRRLLPARKHGKFRPRGLSVIADLAQKARKRPPRDRRVDHARILLRCAEGQRVVRLLQCAACLLPVQKRV